MPTIVALIGFQEKSILGPEDIGLGYKSSMEIRHLLALDAVLATGSFTSAAAARHVSQPALWAQIKDLEAELGFALFVRSGRGVAPTAGCDALREHLENALRGIKAFRSIAGDIREGWDAPARIGCAASHVSHFLAACIRALRDEEPKTPFPVIVPVTSETAGETLARGGIDLLVEPRAKAAGRHTASLYPVHLMALGAVATSHAGSAMEVRMLHRAPVATLPPGSLARTTLEDAARRSGITLQIIYESRDTRSLVALAQHGLCTAVVHDEMLDPEQARSSVHMMVSGRPLKVPLRLSWRPTRLLSPAARALRDLMLRRAELLRRSARS